MCYGFLFSSKFYRPFSCAMPTWSFYCRYPYRAYVFYLKISKMLLYILLLYNFKIQSSLNVFNSFKKLSSQIVYTFYKRDLNIDTQKFYRDMIHDVIKDQGLIVLSFAVILNISKNKSYLFIHLIELMKHSMQIYVRLIFIAPVTTFIIERSFSMLKILKYYRSTMTRNG